MSKSFALIALAFVLASPLVCASEELSPSEAVKRLRDEFYLDETFVGVNGAGVGCTASLVRGGDGVTIRIEDVNGKVTAVSVDSSIRSVRMTEAEYERRYEITDASGATSEIGMQFKEDISDLTVVLKPVDGEEEYCAYSE